MIGDLLNRMVSKILVAVDGSENSERAFNTAIEIARKFEAQLLIVNVLEDFGNAAKVWKKHDLVVRELEKEHDVLLRKYQEVAAKTLSTAVETIRAEGNAAEQILKIARRKRAGMIVIGSRGLSTAKEFFLGSVSHKIIHHSAKPVLVVK
jgi:nucleotide-binding universal stress UspA family protein